MPGMGDKTDDEALRELYAKTAAPRSGFASPFHSVLTSTPTWGDRCATSHHASPAATRATFDKATDDRLAQARAAPPLDESRQLEAEFRKMLAEAGITEAEYNVAVAYVREALAWGYRPTESDIENRILATRPQQPRFPGKVDARGYTIGLIPKTEMFGEALAMGIARFAEGIAQFIKLVFTDPKVALSLALDFLPVIGDIKGMYEAIAGKDLITGEKLPNWVRALSFGLSVHGAAKAGWKLTSAGFRMVAKAGSRVAAKAIAPVVFFAAITHRSPTAAMQFMKNAAHMDETALKVALEEARHVKGALEPTQAQARALQELSRLLTPDEIAGVEKAMASKAAKPGFDVAPPAAPGKGHPDLPDMPGRAPPGRSAPGRAERRPKGSKPKPKPKTSAKTRTLPEERTRAYRKAGFKRKDMGDTQYTLWGRYQVKKTGKAFEQGTTLKKNGREVRIDDLEIDKANPELLNLVDYKHSKEVEELDQLLKKSGNKFDGVFFKELSKSGHYAGFADKIDQFLRQAQLILENPTALNRIIIRCNDSRTAFIYTLVKDNLYGNIYEKVGRKFVKSDTLEKIIDAIKIEVDP
jgi:Pre-toxin TG